MPVLICSSRLMRVAVVLILGFLSGVAVQPRALFAQDGGQLLSVTPLMTVDASALRDGRLCAGNTAILPVTVEFQVSAGEGELGELSVQSVAFEVSAEDSSIARATAVANPGGLEVSLIPSRIDVAGLAPGSTTIKVDAMITTETRLSLDEEVALPIPRTSHVKASVPVQVVPCHYRVDILSVWNTNLFGAQTLYLYTLSNELLESTTGISFENRTSDALKVRWTTAINRIRGCLVSSPRFDDYVPVIRGDMGTRTISLSIKFHEIAPGLPFARELCPVPAGITPGDCPAYPDGVCFVSPHPSIYRWTPEMPAEGLIFAINGESLTESQTLRHPEGTAQGTMFITLTPVLP